MTGTASVEGRQPSAGRGVRPAASHGSTVVADGELSGNLVCGGAWAGEIGANSVLRWCEGADAAVRRPGGYGDDVTTGEWVRRLWEWCAVGVVCCESGATAVGLGRSDGGVAEVDPNFGVDGETGGTTPHRVSGEWRRTDQIRSLVSEEMRYLISGVWERGHTGFPESRGGRTRDGG